ncbi:MAG: two-component sensor histidine kinase [Labilithrix sp.]|nr:two-component sensor histidine kinase [Labilithrix sp.]
MNSSVDFQQLFEASPNPYMLLDAKLCFVAANRAYLLVTGSRLEDLLGRPVLEAFPHDRDYPENESARMLSESLLRVLETRERDVIALIRYRVPRFPGGPPEDRCWSATHTPILGANGEVALILQHTVDITEIERLKATTSQTTNPAIAQMAADVLGRASMVQAANTLLGEELERLRTLFEQAPVLTCVFSGSEHVVELANASYRRLFGDRPLQGKSVREALPELAGQGLFELLDRVFRTGEPYIGKAMTLLLQNAPDDIPRMASIDIVYLPLLDIRGRVAGIFAQGVDITEQRKIEVERERLVEERGALLLAEQAARADAERANRLKDEFLATVSHELRTPLTAIIGWLQMMRSGQLASDRRTRALETIDRNARALAQLVEDILDVSRIMSGKMQLEVEPVRVMDPTSSAIEAIRPAADAKWILLHATLDPAAAVMGDPARLQQVVWNLLANAVKFTPPSGRVDVLVERRESSVTIAVEDTGAGVDAAFLPHVFERFRQAESGTTRRHGGLGLGLAIVKHLVELHGGTVSAKSNGAGRGSLFAVHLPLALVRRDVRPVTLNAPFDCPPEIRGMKILIVEDESDTRELLREILTRCGAAVELAASTAEGINALARCRPDLIVSDIGMPQEDGFTFIRRIRTLPEDGPGRVPVVALTAFARTEDRTAALRAGFRAHVPKPIDIGELLAVIASLAPSRR